MGRCNSPGCAGLGFQRYGAGRLGCASTLCGRDQRQVCFNRMREQHDETEGRPLRQRSRPGTKHTGNDTDRPRQRPGTADAGRPLSLHGRMVWRVPRQAAVVALRGDGSMRYTRPHSPRPYRQEYLGPYEEAQASGGQIEIAGCGYRWHSDPGTLKLTHASTWTRPALADCALSYVSSGCIACACDALSGEGIQEC